MLGTPRGHPCARAPHVQPDGPVLGTCALPALQDSPPLSTAAAYTAVPHQGSTDLVHGAEGAHGCRVNAALAQYAGCLAPEAPGRQARQAMLCKCLCGPAHAPATTIQVLQSTGRAQADQWQRGSRRRCARPQRQLPCAQNAHCLAAQLKADQARQRVVARPHADVCHVQIPASAPAARISCLLTWPCCSDR